MSTADVYTGINGNFVAAATAFAQLFVWDTMDGGFVKDDDVQAGIFHGHQRLPSGEQFPASYLVAVTAAEPAMELFVHLITAEMRAIWVDKPGAWSMSWYHRRALASQSVAVQRWRLVFSKKGDLNAFMSRYEACVPSPVTGSVNTAAQPASEGSITTPPSNTHSTGAPSRSTSVASHHQGQARLDGQGPQGKPRYIPRDSDYDEDDLYERDSDSEKGSESEESETDSESDDPTNDLDDSDENADGADSTGIEDGISQMVVGHNGRTTFALRGDRVEVYQKDDETIKRSTATKKFKYKGRDAFKPSNVMLHERDTKMVMMNPRDPTALYCLDLETNKVVEHWSMGGRVVNNLSPRRKFAQTTDERVFVGTSSKAFFSIDPRMGGRGNSTVVDVQDYSTDNKFTCAATTETGALAVGSQKGDVRLYSECIGKRAKSALSPLGEPILGVDVSSNGRYAVATCKTYLLFYDMEIKVGRNMGRTGFEISFPSTAKAIPKFIRLKPEHEAYLNHQISFSMARFNTGRDQVENTIVSSTGRHVIAWKLDDILENILTNYVMKRYEETIVQDNFVFGNDEEIVVAFPSKILALTKKSLKKASKSKDPTGTDGSRAMVRPGKSAVRHRGY